MARLWDPFIHSISRHFRMGRSRLFLRVLPDFNELKVCDLGGSSHFWEKVESRAIPRDLTLLNVRLDGQSENYAADSTRRILLYDGEIIPFDDGHFDVTVCNSVIEHVPVAHRGGFVAELLRTSQYFFIQTPAYVFPVEPHFVFPALHWLPRPIARRLVRFGLWNLLSRPSAEHRDRYFEEVHLLTLAEFRAYFPGATLHTETVFGIPKSYILHGESARILEANPVIRPALQSAPASAPSSAGAAQRCEA